MGPLSCLSDKHFQPAGPYRLPQGFVVALGLVGIRDREVGDSLVEHVALAQVAANLGWLPERAWERARIQPQILP